MHSTAIQVSTIPPLDHAEAMQLAGEEAQRFLALVTSLGPDDWGRPTDNTEWDVRAVLAHLVGWAEAGASRRENRHQWTAGPKLAAAEGRTPLDGVTATHVHDRAGIPPAELIQRYRRALPAALRTRRRLAAPLRAKPARHGLRRLLALAFSVPPVPLPLGYVTDVLMTRDTWMHRVDLCRATGRPLELTAAHDGRLVADVVADWARRHGRPFALTLEGPAGGSYVHGQDGERHRLDAVEFCRILSGRAPGEGLLTTHVAF